MLTQWEVSLGLGSVEEGSDDIVIPLGVWAEVLQDIPSWKAPGRDKIPGLNKIKNVFFRTKRMGLVFYHPKSQK